MTYEQWLALPASNPSKADFARNVEWGYLTDTDYDRRLFWLASASGIWSQEWEAANSELAARQQAGAATRLAAQNEAARQRASLLVAETPEQYEQRVRTTHFENVARDEALRAETARAAMVHTGSYYPPATEGHVVPKSATSRNIPIVVPPPRIAHETVRPDDRVPGEVRISGMAAASGLSLEEENTLRELQRLLPEFTPEEIIEALQQLEEAGLLDEILANL